ncbi:MAG TPA: hypothetical protein VLD37_01370 [Candidatus Bilamarchaeum sp.]|nr:hypothetical protein [Candidatus Bilamarchaeum sp.]
MTSKNFVFGAIVLVLLAAAVWAQGSVIGQESLNETQVIIVPGGNNGTLLNISVLAFAPATTTGGTTTVDVMREIYQTCAGNQTCIQREAQNRFAASREYQVNLTPIQDAHFVVEYFNPQGNAYHGLWSPVPNCQDVIANIPATAYRPDSTGGLVPYTYYTAQCDVSGVAGAARTYFRVTFVPQPGQLVSMSSAEYEYNNAHVDTSTQFSQDIQNFINGISASGGAGIGVGSLPCVAVFMIMGLLLASLYFAGKSPVSLLDITTPRLPSPKGVTASGQILAPFGYTEMKRTVGVKMREATNAIATSTSVLGRGQAGDAETRSLRDAARTIRGTAADAAAAGSPGDIAQGRKVAEGLVVAGRSLGIGARDLQPLVAKLPYHYGEAEHKVVSQILQGLEARGGREALMAMTFKDYMYGLQTFKSLEVLTAHPDVGKRSAFHYRLTGTLGKFYGSNRYAILSGVVMAGTDSMFRTGRVLGRMGKAMVTETPHLARATARTTMEMLGGARAVEELEAKGRTSPTAAWMAGQLQKHPSQVVVGAMYPINDKMGHLYKTLRSEAMADEMRYVLRQIYKKMGMSFNVGAEELASMGHVDMDVLKRSNFHASAELAQAEAEIRRILGNSAMGSVEKLNALTALAKTHGATIDHQMLAFSQKLETIEHSGQEDHLKMIMLQQALEEQNKVRMAVAKGGGRQNEDAFVSHVGGESLRGPQVWESMVLRTMIWDGEHGFLKGGIKEELLSARLNVVNRLTSLDPTTAVHELPEFMRNEGQLKAVAARNKADLIQLFSEDGKKQFEQYATSRPGTPRDMSAASIATIVDFMYGGNMERTGHMDKKTGRMTWWASDMELGLSQNATLVDVKRHWSAKLDPRENYAIGQWVESRFTRSYIPAYKASVEAELNRMPGSSTWTVEQRGAAAKKLWVAEELMKDVEMKFNSHYANNAYGTTRETTRFYAGIVAGFMEKALQEKGIENNHPDRRFLESMDMTNPKHLGKLQELMKTYSKEYHAITHREMTYDDIARANKAVVMLHEGGYAYYKKGMMLSDYDRIMAGETALRDNKGVLRKYIPEEVPVKFAGRDDLEAQFHKVRGSKDANEWQSVVQSVSKWANEGGYNYDKQKVLGAVLWEYAHKTGDYERFWKESAVTVEAKRQVTPVAPSTLRFFGVEGNSVTPIIKPFRDMAMHGGDYISKVALAAGGPLLKTSYDITPVSSIYRLHSHQLASRIMSGQGMEGLTEQEKSAYRAVANSHGQYLQVWQYAIDRNPWRSSTSFGTHQAWSSFFQFGPAVPFSVSDNLRAFMGRGEYRNFTWGPYGFAMNAAGKLMRPYINMMRGMQMSMQGYASRWDTHENQLMRWNYTEPRIHEAMQSLNPFSAKILPGRTYERIAKLNGMGGSLERHQLSGPDYYQGLRQATQDISYVRKGIRYSARTMDANPGETVVNERNEHVSDVPMAEYVIREKYATYMFDNNIRKVAMDNTVRRTVSAEALAIRRDQEIRGFGVLQNSLFGWANPVSFLWHMPVPGMPSSLTPKDIVANWVRRSKHGGGGGTFGDGVKRMAEDAAQGTSRFMQPHRISMIVYCPRCGTSGYRGSACKACRAPLY